MAVRTDPGNLFTLYKASTNLIDALHDAAGGIVLHDEVLIDCVRSPCLSARHWRPRNFAQLARFLQTAVPLSDRPLPFTDRQRLSRDVCSHITTDSSGDNINAIV